MELLKKYHMKLLEESQMELLKESQINLRQNVIKNSFGISQETLEGVLGEIILGKISLIWGIYDIRNKNRTQRITDTQNSEVCKQ